MDEEQLAEAKPKQGRSDADKEAGRAFKKFAATMQSL